MTAYTMMYNMLIIFKFLDLDLSSTTYLHLGKTFMYFVIHIYCYVFYSKQTLGVNLNVYMIHMGK